MHTHVWPHAPGTPVPTFAQLEAYCEAAAAVGITELAITEHCYRFTRIADEVLPSWDRPGADALQTATDRVLAIESGGDLDAYVEALVDAQRRGLPILVGLEVDHLPGTAAAMDAVLADYPFDVLLGSVHWLGPWLFDDYGTPAFADQWDTRDVDEVWGIYVDEILELAASGRVDVLAHLDLVKVAGRRPADVEPHHRRLVAGLADTSVAVEISTAGWLKPAAELYPAPGLLSDLHRAGVSFTTASDAHTSDRIGQRYDDLTQVLAEVGITELVTFRRRERRPYPLPV